MEKNEEDQRNEFKQYHRKIVAKQKNREAQHVRAILELKANTEASVAEIRGANEALNRSKELQKERESKEFDTLLNQGKNPHEVFRRRTMERRAKRKLKQQNQKIKSTEMGIARRLIEEDEIYQKKNAARREHERHLAIYQKEIGRSAKEDRINDYMIKKTQNELIDPSGRMFRIEPSQVTTIKDHSFGLGKHPEISTEKRNEVIDLIQSNKYHRMIKPCPIFLPKDRLEKNLNENTGNLISEDGEDEDERIRTFLPPINAPPGSYQSNNLHISSNKNKSIEQKAREREKRETYQKNKLQDSLKRNKYRIEKQVVWGKEFKGQAFLPFPVEIWFRDFTVEKTEKIILTLTNVSNTFNYFRLLPFDPEVTDFFKISYQKPGRMSAGTSCQLKIQFSPQTNKDIFSKIEFLAQTGKFYVPLKCTTKKMVPKVTPEHSVQFDQVVLGEKKNKIIKLKNLGALESRFFVRIVNDNQSNSSVYWNISCNSGETSPEVQSESVSVDSSMKTVHDSPIVSCKNESQLIKYCEKFYSERSHNDFDKFDENTVKDYQLKSYGHSEFIVSVYPLAPGNFNARLEILFSDPSIPENLISVPVPPINLALLGTATPVPAYIEKKIIDLNCIVFKKLYRTRVVLKNRGKIALKCQIQPPSILKKYMEFTPSFGYIQGTKGQIEGRFEIQIKFRPSVELLQELIHSKFAIYDGLTQPDTGICSGLMAVPVLVSVPGQTLPVFFIIKAKLTSSTLSFAPSRLDFQSCFVNQAIQSLVNITNHSLLPQKYGFVKLPPEIIVEPNDGFGTLLPKESKEISIKFNPISAITLENTLTCWTSLNIHHKLHVKGVGVTPPLQFSSSVIRFGAITLNEYVVESVVVANGSRVGRVLEFSIPEEGKEFIRIMPLVEVVESNTSKRLEIEFSPNESIFTSEEEKLYGCTRNWLIPCFVKPSTDEEQTQRNDILLYLDIHATVVVEPLLLIEPRVAEFGPIAVGCVKTIEVQFLNKSSSAVILSSKPLNACGPFTVINSLRELTANGGSLVLHIQFRPSCQQFFEETLEISSIMGIIHIPVSGEGVSPSLTIRPENRILDMKNLLVGDKCSSTFELVNSSSFPLKYQIKCQEVMESGYNDFEVFTCIPNEAIIPTGNSQIVSVTFSPDHVLSNEYMNTFKIELPNQVEEHIVTFKGRCWENQTYLLAGANNECYSEYRKNEQILEDIFELPSNIQSSNDQCTLPNRLLTFEFSHTNIITHTMRIGSISLSSEGEETRIGKLVVSSKKQSQSSAGNFEIELDDSNPNKKYFSIQPTKGTINPGQEIEVKVAFMENKTETDNATPQFDIQQWIQVRGQCILKGGYQQPSISNQTIELLLRASIQL